MSLFSIVFCRFEWFHLVSIIDEKSDKSIMQHTNGRIMDECKNGIGVVRNHLKRTIEILNANLRLLSIKMYAKRISDLELSFGINVIRDALHCLGNNTCYNYHALHCTTRIHESIIKHSLFFIYHCKIWKKIQHTHLKLHVKSNFNLNCLIWLKYIPRIKFVQTNF